MLVAAFDPGRNIGFVLVDEQGRVLRRRLLVLSELAALEIPEESVTVVGDGTGSRELRRLLASRGVTPILVDETGTSLEGREIYFRENPPTFPWRLLPRGLWWPPRSIDDYAAQAIALRYLGSLGGRGLR